MKCGGLSAGTGEERLAGRLGGSVLLEGRPAGLVPRETAWGRGQGRAHLPISHMGKPRLRGGRTG